MDLMNIYISRLIILGRLNMLSRDPVTYKVSLKYSLLSEIIGLAVLAELKAMILAEYLGINVSR